MEPQLYTSSIPNAARPACDYVVHPNGIHEIIYNEVSHAAVDQCVAYFEQSLLSTPPEGKVMIMTNGTRVKAMQPVAYLMRQFRALAKRNNHGPEMRIVILYDKAVTASALNGLFRAFVRGRDQMRMFKFTERDAAMEWMLKD